MQQIKRTEYTLFNELQTTSSQGMMYNILYAAD